MAGVSIAAGGKGGKKPVDANVNLVPFIDLLASLIAFLMMTAVWTQIGAMKVSQAGGGSDAVPTTQPLLPITLLLTERGYSIGVGPTSEEVPRKNGAYDGPALVAKLREAKARQPEQGAITVSAEDAIEYQELVRAIDGCISAGLPDVSVQAAL